MTSNKTPNKKHGDGVINRRRFLMSTGAVAGLGAVGSIPVQAQQDRTTLGKALFSQLIVHYDIDNIRTPSHTDQVSFFQKTDDELYVPVISEGDAETIRNNDGILITNKLNPLPTIVNRGSSEYLTVQKTDYHQPVTSVRLTNPIPVPGIQVESGFSGSLEVKVGAREKTVDAGEIQTIALDPRPIRLDSMNIPAGSNSVERSATPLVTIENHGVLNISATEVRGASS